jgi:hypothetical protein
MLLNVAASTLALGLARTYGWTFGATGPSQRWTQVFLAGLAPWHCSALPYSQYALETRT